VNKVGQCLAIVLTMVAAHPGSSRARELHPSYPVAYAHAAATIRGAERGDVAAQARLGWMYSTGRGVPQDYYEAAKWYYRAANQGHGEAQFALGMLYNKGEGVPRDFVLAYMWLNLSASQAVGENQDFKARMRDAIATKMTVRQVQMAQGLALAWYSSR
jgi:TPR repeat protein